MPSKDQILADIDSTIDQLIKNAAIFHLAPIKSLQENEIAAIQKTQDSLLARLLHMEALIEKGPKIQVKNEQLANEKRHEKIAELARLNSQLMRQIENRFRPMKKPRRTGRALKKQKRGWSSEEANF